MKELDAFPKVPESYVESTTSGGTGTDCTFLAVANLRREFKLIPFQTLSSVSDSIHFHGCPRLLRVLCVQTHMDEVRIRGGQRLQQVKTEQVYAITALKNLSAVS